MARVLVAGMLLLISGLGGIFWYYESLAPEARTGLRQKLGIPVSKQEALQAAAHHRLSTFGRATIFKARMTVKGDLCGHASVSTAMASEPAPERFILSPGKFFEFGSNGLEPLGDPEWMKIAQVRPIAIATSGRPLADANRYLLQKNWETVCGEVLPTSETAADLRAALVATLKHPASAMFRNDRLVDLGYCGELNAKGSTGALTGFTRFYVVRGELWQSEGSAPIPLKAGGWGTSSAKDIFAAGKATPAQIQGFFDNLWKKVCG